MQNTVVTSRVGAKSQTVVPRAVREALGIGPGDEIAYVIDGPRVVLVKVAAVAEPDPFAFFEEWASEADKVYDSI